MKNNLILEGIKKAIIEGEARVVNEASTLTGSGSGIGGNVVFDDAFSALRMANPLRMFAREIPVKGSDAAFVVKTGNVTNATNPWGYVFTPNVGTPGIATSFWQLPVRTISVSIPVRTAVLSDINMLDESIVQDLALEFAAVEAQSMMYNNDQSGTTTTTTGGLNGLRGLDSYTSGSAPEFGTNGSAITNGIHTINTVASTTANALAYNDIVVAASTLPAQYWNFDTTAWYMHPNTILALRELTASTSGLPVFLEIGQPDGNAVGNIFGHKVIANPWMDQIGAGNTPVYLADWSRFLTIGDGEELVIKRYDQSSPGFLTIYAEKRVVSTVRDVFAGLRIST